MVVVTLMALAVEIPKAVVLLVEEEVKAQVVEEILLEVVI